MNMMQQTSTLWKRVMLAMMLALTMGLFAFAPAAQAATPFDDHEEAEAESQEITEELIQYLVFLESAKYGNDNVMGALDRLNAGDLSACGVIVDAADWSFILGALAFADPSFTPPGYEGISSLAEEAMLNISNGIIDIVYVCRNGKTDTITSFQYAVAKSQLEQAQTKLYAASSAAVELSGIQVDPIPELLELLLALFQPPAGPWSAAVFEADIDITIQTLAYMGGWLDRALAGETVYCLEYMVYVAFLSGAIFETVPGEWQNWVNEHYDLIDQVKDTSRSLFLACDALGNDETAHVSDFVLQQAREGVTEASNRAHRISQEFDPQ